MNKSVRILITGHRGMVGSALVPRLQAGGYDNLLNRPQHRGVDKCHAGTCDSITKSI